MKRIEKILTKKDCTIPEICKELGTDREFDVISKIGDLESIGKVCFKGFRTFYEPDGRAGYLAVYGCV